MLFDQRVPMRDGATLSADVTLPAAALAQGERVPVILMRTPYVKSNILTVTAARYYAERGYAYMAMDVRGRGDSDGVFDPRVNDGIDGYDAIEWLAAQPWSDGNIGTIGGSYPGCIQWLTALHQPPHLRAMIVLVTPADPFVETPTGLPHLQDLCWLHFVSGRVNQPMESVNWDEIYTHLPLATMDERVGRSIPIWREQISHAQLDDYWRRICYQNQFDRVNVPVLHISGWYDDEEVGTPANFAAMVAAGRAGQRLLMGPWGHAVNTTRTLG